MPKYTEAFFNITHKPVTIMQIRNEYNLDHTVYERRYKGHIFCPYCKAVPLQLTRKHCCKLHSNLFILRFLAVHHLCKPKN